jgi:hypothetical protein
MKPLPVCDESVVNLWPDSNKLKPLEDVLAVLENDELFLQKTLIKT